MPVMLLAAAAGAAAGPWLRAMIFRYAALAGGVSMRGRCPFCGTRIGPRRGVVELTTAVTLALLAVRPADRLTLVTLCGIGLVGVVLAFGLGVVLGWTGWSTALLGTLVGLALAAGCGAVLLALRRVGRKDPLPHG